MKSSRITCYDLSVFPALILLIAIACGSLFFPLSSLPLSGVARMADEMKNGDKRIHILFRLDDASARSNAKAEEMIFDVFRKSGFKLCVAVIPFVGDIDGSVWDGRTLFPYPSEKSGIIKKGSSDGTLEVALHGYSHFSIAESNLSEFSGLDFEAQKQRLIESKRFLEDLFNTRINVFVPPFNTYDTNTIRALDLLDFRILSAAIFGSALPAARILFIPATCGLQNLRAAVGAARRAPDRTPLIVALFHHYDFKEVDASQGALTLGELDSLLEWMAEQRDVKVLSMEEAAERLGENLSVCRFIAVDKWRRLERFLPDRMKEKKPVLYYHEARALHSLLWKLALIYFGLLILSGFCAFGFLTILSLYSPKTIRIVIWGATVVALTTVVYALRDFSLSRRGLAVSTISLGVLLGTLCHYLGSW
jgi:peptidoglycan/xylan/chitin deacetylase (PgdA/CDA1 family)